jgi:monofunctional biosynthetic peptidoglycan transglycosylase
MLKKFFKYLLYSIGGFFLFTILWVVAYKFIDPPFTPLMILRKLDFEREKSKDGIQKEWKDYEEISTNLYHAILAAEDQRFVRHGGIDWKAVEAAKRYNASHKGKRLHGASTVTMQTAKNTFLWHGRNYVRKGLEAYFTYLIEFIWGKKRILEVYVNVVEWGNEVYGAEAAARKYFKKSAKKLTKREAALLAVVLPNPNRWNPARPTNYINRRANKIMSYMYGTPIPKVDKKKKGKK